MTLLGTPDASEAAQEPRTVAGRTEAGPCSTVGCAGVLTFSEPFQVHPQLYGLRRAQCPVCGLRWWADSPDGRVVTTVRRGWDHVRAAAAAVRRQRYAILRAAQVGGLGAAVGAAAVYAAQRMG